MRARALARALARRASTTTTTRMTSTSASSSGESFRELNARGEHARVIAMYESRSVEASERDTAEYLKALVHANRVHESALAAAVHRGATGTESARSALNTGIINSLGSIFTQRGVGGGEAGAAAAAASAVLGSEKNPLYTQQLEPTFKAQLWRTVRTLGTAFIVLSGIGALLEDRGGMSKAILGGESAKPQQTAPLTRFDDVKGVDEAKAELVEIVEYLKEPERFTKLGGKLPKGLLLVGPPGTGKTMLAKAVAGEAGVPFFYTSGSEFEEMFVGVGARRVRDLFKAAKQNAPCIIFIDEIDAVGAARNPKDQQNTRMTLNQLLTELDGFKASEGVIVLAATNTPGMLDKALIRPGRFDRTVSVPNPDVGGRRDILRVHARGVKFDENVDFDVVARGTPGFSGADLANLINIAALKAALDGVASVGAKHLDFAKDRILMGAERTSAILTPENRKLTAYHEGGHALVALRTKGARPVHKATIVPRGQALGMVMQLPEKDELQMTRRQLLAMLDVTMGGRVAEELIFGSDEITTGASSDLQQATRLAREMVTRYGMSDTVGLASQDYASDELSSETRQLIEIEVKAMLDAAYKRAKDLLTKHEGDLHAIARRLLDSESLSGNELKELCGIASA
ncbi:P-loop containing nucleoside triphosphate hydrolase [Ostreococcus tauri]|uniref:P-loop containing nucleoside triphosphate hydrolase n=1 Tax=Ostreococcus tauri TaxID=70448 RepID=A0A096P945_OSTTA|nr:P-loop containing nucleoside triphosphate hydrolase [Ostreococcus tauri]CEG00475.1 P-loop containing nucleoside triphosphate hydrolase [Ostreococcus tauri]|eukprot:XP_003083761.2 P-loop containing nucleoside triphosphate hydrolase [Ostreococcus tauri]